MKPVFRDVLVRAVAVSFAVLCVISTTFASDTQNPDSSVVQPAIDSTKVAVSDSVSILKQRLMEIEKKLYGATTESEKNTLLQEIEQIKKRLSVLLNNNYGSTSIPVDTFNLSERAKLIAEIDRCNKELSVATTEEQKKSLFEKITALKMHLAELDKLNIATNVAPVSQIQMLEQEIVRLNEMLAKATTESEKNSLLEKIELMKKQRASLENVYVQPPVPPLSEKEMLLRQILDLKKALSVATTEEDKKLFTTKIDYLTARIAHLDSLAAGKDTVAIQSITTELKYIDDLIMKKKSELSALLQNGQNDKAAVVEKELTLLMEKRAQLVTTQQRDTVQHAESTEKPDYTSTTNDQRLIDLKAKYASMQSQQDTLRSRITGLAILISGADSTAALQELKKQLALLTEKLNSTIVAMEKIRLEEAQLNALLESREETAMLKESAAATKTEADSLLKLMREKNSARMVLIKNQADTGKLAAATAEMLALKGEYLTSRGEFATIRTQIHEVRIENQQVHEALQQARITLVANDKVNNRGLYEVSMNTAGTNDTSKAAKVRVKLNVNEPVGGEVEIVEEIIDQAPSGKKGIRAFDITPSVDLLISMENAEIALPFDLEDIAGIDARKLTIHYYDVQQGWIPVEGCTVDVEKRVVIATVTHFSVYGIFADGAVAVQQSGNKNLQQLSMTTRNVNTTVAFDISLPGKSFVRLHIYSIDGRLVSKPIAGMYKEGRYSLIWDGSNGFRSSAARGTYIAQLMVKDALITKTFSLIK